MPKAITTIADLVPDNRNANKGTKRGRDLLETSLRELGAGRSVLADREGRLIAGNKTAEVAAELGLSIVEVEADGHTLVVVKRTDLDLEQDDRARQLAYADNRVGQVSLDWDTAQIFDDMQSGIDLGNWWFDDELDKLLNQTDGASDSLESDDDPLTRLDVPDALWATDNDWGIPTLDLRKQADALDLPITRWGSISRHNARMPGTWHFYTDDYKFDALWDDPTPVVNSGCVNVIEPNFSTGQQMARAVALWGVFRKRWLARWWQSQGVRIFVDLNVEPQFHDLNLLGVPTGWRSYATRGDLDLIEQDYAVACEHAGTDDLLFVVYGGPKALKTLCVERGWIWLPEDAQVKEGRWDNGQRL